MDCIVDGVAKSRTGLSDFHFATGYIFVWASLIPQLVKNPPVMQETLVDSLVRKIRWRRDRIPAPVFLGFPGGSAGKESTYNAGDPSQIPGL